MCQNVGLHIGLLVVLSVMATGGETRSRGKVPGPPPDHGAAVPDLHNGLDDCKKDRDFHPSCTSWAESGECEPNSGAKKGCFGCSLSGQLWEAAWRGNLSEVDTAIAAGANLLCTNPNRLKENKGYYIWKTTAIHMAAMGNHPGVVKALLDAGVDVNLQTTVGATPTLDASWTGSIDALNLLIEHNADVNLPSSNGMTALITAARRGQLITAKALISANASLDVTGGRPGGTALYYAVGDNNPDVALLLIENNADVNLPASGGRTPLMTAAWHGQLSTVKALLSANASLDVTGGWAGTALGYAASSNNQDIALLLLQSGADTKITDRDGRIPAEKARLSGHNQLADLIENHTSTGGTITTGS